VLHFLVHGAVDHERELPGALALAPDGASDDGLLWCEELFALELRSPPLVLLSSCGSARGQRRMGDDGLAQLGGAVLSKGARCTVEARADIALRSTLQLMETFSGAVAEGASPARAMLTARRALVADGDLSRPFHAYALRVVGLGFEPILRREAK
jgi:CHAT domain-containing protein